MDDAHAHLIVGDLLQTLLHSLGRALHVGLDHDGQFLHVVLCHLAEQVIQRDLLEGGELLLLGGSDALLGQFTGQTLVLNSLEQVACFRHCGQAGDLHRGGGAGIGQQLTLVVAHGTHTAHGGTGDDDITGVQRRRSAGCRSAPEWWQWGPGPCPDGPRRPHPWRGGWGLPSAP